MSFDMPGWVEPVLAAYGIPWPDVDEDAFHWVQQPLRSFGHDLVAVSDAIESAVQELEAGNPSQTLNAIGRYCGDIRRDFLDPIQTVCDDLAGQPCELAYQGVVAVKAGLVALLLYEIGSDVADVVETAITLGADSAVTFAEMLAVRKLVEIAVQEGEAEVGSLLQSLADRCLDNLTNSLINPFINSVETNVEARVDAYVPMIRLSEALAAMDESAARRLHLSPEAMNRSIAAIWQSSQHLLQAASTLEQKIDEIFDRPDPSAPRVSTLSQSMRRALQSVMQTVKSELVGGVETLIQHVERHFVTLLEDFASALAELDADARRLAATERIAAGPEVVVLSAAASWAGASSLIDPTTDRVNVAAADQVEVGDAVSVGFAASLDAPSDGQASVTADASFTPQDGGVDRLDVKADLDGPGIAAVDNGVGRVEELAVKVDQAGPQLGLVQGPASSPQTLGVHHGDQGSVHATPVDAHADAAGMQHLHVRREDHGPNVSSADGSSGAGVEGVTGNVTPEVDTPQP